MDTPSALGGWAITSEPTMQTNSVTGGASQAYLQQLLAQSTAASTSSTDTATLHEGPPPSFGPLRFTPLTGDKRLQTLIPGLTMA
jgi:hypothetical protein